MKRHKWADELIAIAEGREIEGLEVCGRVWELGHNSFNPITHSYYQWRIKPKPKPDVIRHFSVYINELKVVSISAFGVFLSSEDSSVKLTFDGETNKLKSAEVINDDD